MNVPHSSRWRGSFVFVWSRCACCYSTYRHIYISKQTISPALQIGRVLPMLARSVLKAVMPDIPHEHADYNVVQNNGESTSHMEPFLLLSKSIEFSTSWKGNLIKPPRLVCVLPGPGAAQVVPHVHFHIVPRPPLNYKYPTPSTLVTTSSSSSSSGRKYAQNKPPAGRQATAILFGRGMREDLDYDEAAVLVEAMRAAVREEWQASFGSAEDAAGGRGAISTTDTGGADIETVEAGGSGRRGAWKV